MKIAIGNIGGAPARRLPAAGHRVSARDRLVKIHALPGSSPGHAEAIASNRSRAPLG
ncbi:hypothetical protein [Rhizorhabdus argentea]|uniref:hypothetical protein n=1 Tax=Rhizorhabdus argentea TaxID=1387174 RepID=UPI0030EF8C99